ncbi:ABC transporter permease [Thalassospira sp. MA62]|nr:ABC transporter permease [Thalassospira sp. MA62]
MTSFILKRVGFSFITLFCVLTLVFFAVRILPGDPAIAILGDQASQEALVALRERLGLDQPILSQYADFIQGVLIGQWGTSMVSGRPVIAEIFKVLPATIELTFAALVIGAVLGIPMGIWAALRRGKFVDGVVRILSLAGLSAPAFVSAVILLLIFSLELRMFPVISKTDTTGIGDKFLNLALPAVNLGLIMAAYITRVSRSSMLEVMGQDYVRTARAKGLSFATVILRHCMRNSMIPVITVIGLYLGILIGNSVLTEIVFNRPGLGKLIIGALNQRDYTMLQGLMVIYTGIVLMVNLLTDITYGLIDPRIKY